MKKRREKPERSSTEQQNPRTTPRQQPAAFSARSQLTYAHYFLFFLLFLSLFFSYKLFEPYANPIIVATILATLTNPMYQFFVRFCRGRKNLAAFLVCLLLTLIVVLPLTFMLFALIQQGVQSFKAISDWVAAGQYRALGQAPWIVKISALVETYLPDIQRFFPDFNLSSLQVEQMVLNMSSTVGRNLLNQGGQLFGNISALIVKFFLMLFTFFFMIRDQEKIFAAILHLVPLSSSDEDQILTKVRSVARSALLGTFVTAIAQGFVGGIAFHIAHLPGLFWGTAMAFASLIPLVGTALIWVPAALYLLLSGHWGYSLFMTLWCALIVGLIDNFVRPLFMKGSGEDMSTLLIFFSIIGGINYFGLIGLLYGPLIIGILLVLLYIYSLEFKSFLDQQDKS